MIEIVPCLQDNYAYLVTCEATGKVAVVDPSEAEPVLRALAGRPLHAIFATHHHWDHVGGNEGLLRVYPQLEVCGHDSDRGRIFGQTVFLKDQAAFDFGETSVVPMHVPGHTSGAVTYVVGEGKGRAAFTGDTLFAGGCGRLFEGSASDMWNSLGRLMALGAETLVYPGHEYTVDNLAFAAFCEPKNADVQTKLAWAKGQRSAGKPTIPSVVREELQTNPFVRVAEAALRETLSIAPGVPLADALGYVRTAKNEYRG